MPDKLENHQSVISLREITLSNLPFVEDIDLQAGSESKPHALSDSFEKKLCIIAYDS